MKDSISKFIKYIKEHEIVEYIFFTILFVVISVIFADKTGILNSGCHLTDDHEVIEATRYIEEGGYFNALWNCVYNDLGWRFRPLFFLIRVTRAYLFGMNFFWWHLSVAVEVGLYMSASYILARKMKTPVFLSLIFSFIYLVGSQNEIIWRMGTNENTGMLLLPLTLIFALLYCEKKKKVYGVLTTISTILMIGAKESFLLLVPSVFLFMFYIDVTNNENKEDKNIFLLLWDFIKEHYVMIIIAILGIAVATATIFLYSGLMSNDYAGINTSYTFYEYIRITLNVFIRDLKNYLFVFAIILLIVIYSIIDKKRRNELTKKYWRSLLVAFVLCGYSMVVQAVLYASSSMFDRYKLPCLWILFFALIVLCSRILKPLPLSIIVVGVSIYFVTFYFNNGYNVFEDAKSYAYEGEHTTQMFEYIQDRYQEDNDLIVLTDYFWYEHNDSTSKYLQYMYKVPNVYHLNHDRDNGDYKKLYNKDDVRIAKEDADIIITDGTFIGNYDENEYIITKYSPYYTVEKIK